MKKLMISLAVSCLLLAANGQDIPNLELSKLEGGSVTLFAYAGKKMMIVNMPVNRTAAADTMLYCLDTLGAAHAQDLQIIVVPAYEDGFDTTQRATLLQWYRSYLGAGILITDGLHILPGANAPQHPLFEWLTHDTLNESFAVLPDAPGYKFFINASGQLYAVLRPQSKAGSASVQKVLRIQ